MNALDILDGFSAKKVLALINNVGGPEKADNIAAGKLTVTVKNRIRASVDKHGRFIPPEGFGHSIPDADYNYYLKKSDANSIKNCFSRIEENFGNIDISFPEFLSRVEKIIKRVNDNKQISNLLKGSYFPIVLPHLLNIEEADPGRALKEIFIPEIENALQKFSDKEFLNCRRKGLEGLVKIVPDLRYDNVVSAMAKGAVPAVYFPTAFQGYPILACREIIPFLPKEIILSGGYDICVAMIGYLNILARDIKATGLDMASFQWKSDEYILHLATDNENLILGETYLDAAKDHSSGVVILG